MPRDLVSKRTRREFQEHLVGWTLRTIDNLFQDQDLEPFPLPSEYLPPGERRGRVEEYYANIGWTDPHDVRKVLNVYEEVLSSISGGDSQSQGSKEKLVRCLERDGYKVDNDRIRPGQFANEFALVLGSSSRVDLAHLTDYIERIKVGVIDDCELAIGSTKELLEAVLKTILEDAGVAFDRKEDVPQLLRRVQEALELLPGDVDEAKRGAETIRRILGAVGSIVVGLAELRNLYGSGHGKTKRSKGISDRHARLAVGVGTAACAFLLETHELRKVRGGGT